MEFVEFQTAHSYKWCCIQKHVDSLKNTNKNNLPQRQNAITHSGGVQFKLALLPELKREVFLSQLNFTEVSKADNKRGKKKPQQQLNIVITSPEKQMKWNVILPHKNSFYSKVSQQRSVNIKWILEGFCLSLSLSLMF